MRATTSQMSRNGPEGGVRRGPGPDGTATLELFELLEVPTVVSRGLLHRIPAELLQEGLRQDQRRHRLADDPGRRDRRDVRSLDLRLELLLRPHVDAVEGARQGRERLDVD